MAFLSKTIELVEIQVFLLPRRKGKFMNNNLQSGINLNSKGDKKMNLQDDINKQEIFKNLIIQYLVEQIIEK